jgi:hypothetical protein
VTGLLAIPKSFRVMFFGWLKHFSSEYFSRVLLVLGKFLSFILTNKASNLDPTPVVLVLERHCSNCLFLLCSLEVSLFICNQEANIVPFSLFSNLEVANSVDIFAEWGKFKTVDVSKIFNFFSYPFLFPIEAKHKIILSEFRNQMAHQVKFTIFPYNFLRVFAIITNISCRNRRTFGLCPEG